MRECDEAITVRALWHKAEHQARLDGSAALKPVGP